LHDRRYDDFEHVVQLDSSTTTNMWGGECIFSFHLFPTSESIDASNFRSPFIVLLAVAFCVLCFVVFYVICHLQRSQASKQEIEYGEVLSVAIEESAAQLDKNGHDKKLANIREFETVIGTRPDIFLETTVLVRKSAIIPVDPMLTIF
jgi:hypothetical protein